MARQTPRHAKVTELLAAGAHAGPPARKLGLSRRARRERPQRSGPGGAPAGAGPAFLADAGTGDPRGDTEAFPARPAESADLLARQYQAAFDGDRAHVARDDENLWQLTDMQAADMQAADMQAADMQAADMHLADMHLADMQVADMQVADTQLADMQVTDSGSDEPAMRARGVEDGKPAPGAQALAAAVAAAAAAEAAGRPADGGRGRGSLRRRQWSAPPDLPPTGDPGGQDEAGASPDGPARSQARRPALGITVLVIALILGSIIVFVSGTIAPADSPGRPARHVAPARHLPSPGVAGRGRVAGLGPLAGIISAATVPSATVKTTAAAAPKPPFATSGGLAIGRARNSGAPSDWFNGSIAKVEVFNTALTSAQVSALR